MAADDTTSALPLLEMRGIAKSFPGVQALRGVDLELRAGEVLALLGENGAGKSTLIKVLAGAHRPDAGSIRLLGRGTVIRDPGDAQRLGVAVIYQEFNLIPALTARENIFLGREQTAAGFLRQQQEHRDAQALFRRIGVEIDPEAPCRELAVAEQQVVEIAKALSLQARIIVMDEPTATLTPPEVQRLFAIVRDLKAHGLGVIYISHRLEETFSIADRVMVLRDGKLVATRAIGQVTRADLIEMMVGRPLDQEFPERRGVIGADRLVAKNLCRGRKVRDVSFAIRGGEVLGLTGLIGAGRTETARLLFGADRPDSGRLELDGRPLQIRNPRDAMRAGIGLLTEDRKAEGLVLNRSARENFGLPNVAEQLAKYLSGGNQQKVVLSKWLARNCHVIIFDEPTRGIDVGAKYEIYLLIRQLAAQGKAILMISSELPEVLGLSDRILVMGDGRLTGEISDVPNATQQQIMELAVK